MTVLEQIRQQAADAKTAAQTKFFALAESLAKGEPAPADVLAVLQAAGKTPDDLEKRVAVDRERLHLEPLVAAFADIQRERADAEADLKAAEEAGGAEVDELRKRVAERIAPLFHRLEDLKRQEAESRAAKLRLNHILGRNKPLLGAVADAQVEEE